MKDAGQQGFVVAAEVCVAVDRCASEVGTVIALLERQEFGAVALSLDLPVLSGKPERGLDGIGAARGKEGARHAFGLEPFGELVGEFDRWAGRCAAKA